MEYNFREIEKKWQQKWADNKVYQVPNVSDKPKYYVLDMFPYPSGAGLHVGHPLGYIASDIFARYKRLKGFNVLHPMGYDAFGLPAEQYAIEHGVHPAVSTEKNIATFRKQLDNIGFSFDWSREVRTSDPNYYKWTQWIFLQLFKSWYNRKTNKTEPIDELLKTFEQEGNEAHPIPDSGFQIPDYPRVIFTAEAWNNFSEKTQQAILMEYRVAYCGYGEVNWCEALGTVLANDEVVNGVSERGGYPVVKKKLRQWYLRITEYADRLLQGLQTVDFSDAMKEMQSNWIGKSSGAEIEFRLTPNPSPHGEGSEEPLNKNNNVSGHFFKTADVFNWRTLKDYGRENRKHKTEAEDILWQRMRNNQLGVKVRRQHTIQGYIVDFGLLAEKLVIEIDGEYHNDVEQQKYDAARTEWFNEFGLTVLRFTNKEVLNDTEKVIEKIKNTIEANRSTVKVFAPLLREEKGSGDEAETLTCYTTRPDTIFGVDFMVLAPEHDLVQKITTTEQKTSVEEYITYVKSRSERERMAEKKISGVFTGAYAIHPFNGKQIPVWISEYVLAGYGTGAIMAVPSGDERDHKFAQHFSIPITNIFGEAYTRDEAVTGKDLILQNSDFLTGMNYDGATTVILKMLEKRGAGRRKVNYKMRDAAFSRQRYWGEPFPIVWKDGIAYPLDESELPLMLPHVESYSAGPDGEGPLANIPEWALIPSPSPQAEKGAQGAALVPKYSVYTPMQYEFAKQMRKEFTETENLVWQQLRGSKLGVKFRRQHPIDQYIVDFVSLQNNLIVEIDGGYHDSIEQKEYDKQRTIRLKEIGFTVIRFTSKQVTDNLKNVLKEIEKNVATSSPLSPESFRDGEGLRVRETNTMPGYAGSSWYFLRYMDPHNNQTFCDKNISSYWNQVDLYVGGTEHAVGHLLYSRMWTKCLFDLGLITFDEPFKRLLNQGMITGISEKLLRSSNSDIDESDEFGKIKSSSTSSANSFIVSWVQGSYPYSVQLSSGDEYFVINYSSELREHLPFGESLINIPIDYVENGVLNVDDYSKERQSFEVFVCNNGFFNSKTRRWYNFKLNEISPLEFKTIQVSEKMSKSKRNVINPDTIVSKYGADTFRMYEMFLGPVEMSKPWDTKGIEGVHRFLKKLWRLFISENGSRVTDEKATAEELKVLHKTIKKIEEDTERFSFNTCVSAFMVCVNELTDLNCTKKEILEPLLVLLTPYAPHISCELWETIKVSPIGGDLEGAILDANFPKLETQYLVESTKEYPISVNGKLRTTINIDLSAEQQQVEEIVLQNEVIKKWLEGKQPKKIIFVKGKMVNVVM